ncbi:MAG TPA: hemerythrin domain-containing protein [Burkholderiaceae bacterium]|nr:hemerythrin domain-containing protein [Burkholderiaceae bacterium]
MKPKALQVIQDEHVAVAAVLRSMLALLQRSRDERRPPPFDVLRAMLFYVDEFPERQHHPKESELLFPRLRRACPELVPVIDQLDDDHRHGETAIRELEHLMLAFEVMGESRRARFERALEGYVEGYLEHMATEDGTVLPAARAHLAEADWAELDAAFAANRDPLTGHPASEEYGDLFQRIVNRAPAPIGLA